MAQIYFRNGNGERVTVEVTDEVAQTYREELRKEWRSDAYEGYYSTSLDEITDAGHDFADERENVEEHYISREDEKEQADKLSRLAAALASLSPDQRELVEKVYFRGMTQDEIAAEKGVTKQAISDRMKRIYVRLKKYYEKD